MEGVIRKRPWTIIAVWLIVVIIAGPLAASINDIVKTSEEEFLPPTSESIKAEKEMAKLRVGNETAAAPGFMLVVSGVPVDIDSYHRLKAWYNGLKEEYSNASFSSWIDIVENIEVQSARGLDKGLNMSVQAVKGLLATSQTYNKLKTGINQTAGLLEASDRAYQGYWNAGTGLQAGLPLVERISESLNLSCNVFLPVIVKTYYDVIRSEALLEKLTDAYTNPPIDEVDVSIVVKASNITRAGPLNPGIIYAVYNATLANGGPSNFNNTLAADLAMELAWQGLQSTGLPAEAQGLYNATAALWKATVAEMQDHRSIILGAPDTTTGQLQLLALLDQTMESLKPLLGKQIGDSILSQLPPQAAGLANYTVNSIVESNCTVTNKTIPSILAGFLESQGVNRAIAEKIAGDVVEGAFTKEKAARYAVETVVKYAESKGIEIPEPFINLLVNTLLEYDPNASGALEGPQKYGVAAILTLESTRIDLSRNEVETLVKTKSLDEASYIATKLLLSRKAGTRIASFVDLLWERSLLGADNETILKEAPEILAEIAAQQGHNITKNEAEILASYAVMIVEGKLSYDDALEDLVNKTVVEAFDSVIEKIEGVLVERGGNGFLIGVSIDGGNLAEKASTAEHIKTRVLEGLKDVGYSNVKVLLDGNDYMSYEIREAAQRDIEKSDKLSMVFVIIILGLIMESIAAVFLPFIGIGFGLVVSLALAYLLGKYGVVDVTTHSRTIMFTTGLGLGIDYAAYVARRFREAAARGLNSREAAVEAYRKSLRPVLAGATTAMIGFGSMMLAWDFPFISSIGSNVPLTIFSVMIASITFIPALLAYVGETRWFWWPRHPIASADREPRFKGVGKFIASKPLVPLAIAVILAVFAGVVMTGFTGGYDFAINLPRDSEARRALDYINTNYDAGVLYPVYIVASSKEKASEIRASVKDLPCVAKAEVEDAYQDRVVKVVMSVYPMSKDGVECAKTLREKAHTIDPDSLVGGMAAVNLDLQNLINDRFYHRVYPVALTLMFLTFLAAYGGVVTALSAILAVVIAAYAGSALTILLFQDILGEEVMWYLPVIVFTAILGVGMDYNSFYIARAREECTRDCSREGVADSIALGTPTVLGLAAIMAGAYVGLALASSPGLSMMGTALIFGVLLAGINASLILTPPLIALLGRASWWPRYPRGVQTSE